MKLTDSQAPCATLRNFSSNSENSGCSGSTADANAVAVAETPQPPLYPDQGDVYQTLHLLNPLCKPFEVRCLGKRGRTSSRFFHTRNLDRAVDYAGELNSRDFNVYVTLNAVHPQFKGGDGKTTSDADITELCWLLVDVDPVRKNPPPHPDPDQPPPPCMATDAEVASAWEIIGKVRRELEANGITCHIVGASGNGYHNIYPILLLNTEENAELLHDTLKILNQKFATFDGQVDTSVYNPSRISRVYGCINRKGPNTVDRPHRRSELIEAKPWDKATALANVEALRKYVAANPLSSLPPNAALAAEKEAREAAKERQRAKREAEKEKKRAERPQREPRTPREQAEIAAAGDPGDHVRLAYAETALDEEVADVASAPNGNRSTQFNKSAFVLGTLVGAGVLDRGRVEAELIRAAAQVSDTHERDAGIIARGLDAGVRHPRDLSHIGTGRDRDADDALVIDPTPAQVTAFEKQQEEKQQREAAAQAAIDDICGPVVKAPVTPEPEPTPPISVPPPAVPPTLPLGGDGASLRPDHPTPAYTPPTAPPAPLPRGCVNTAEERLEARALNIEQCADEGVYRAGTVASGCFNYCKNLKVVFSENERLGEDRVNYFRCRKLDCEDCREIHIDHYKSTTRVRLASLPADAQVYQFEVLGRRQYEAVTEQIRYHDGIYNSLQIGASVRWLMTTTFEPTGLETPGQWLSKAAAIERFDAAADAIPLVDHDPYNSSKAWKLIPEKRQDPQGWVVTGKLPPETTPQIVSTILATHKRAPIVGECRRRWNYKFQRWQRPATKFERAHIKRELEMGEAFSAEFFKLSYSRGKPIEEPPEHTPTIQDFGTYAGTRAGTG